MEPTRKRSRFGTLVGQRFGRLTVQHAAASRKGQRRWMCLCDCGAVVEAATHSLRSPTGGKSCGCSRRTGVDHSFWSRLQRNAVNGCWEWTGAKTQFGYGKVGFGGRIYDTHRLVYELCCGPIPDGLFVLHHCDNPKCCHPAHLYAGTPRDNMLDCAKRGRKKTKITPEVAKDIRAACRAEPRESYPAIGRRFGVSDTMVRRIDKGLAWSYAA